MTRLLKIVDPLISESFFKTTFVSGLPQEVKCQIQATNAKSSLSLCEVTEIARSILKTQNLASVNVSITNKSDMTKLKCFNCGEVGHSRRACPKIKCFTCGENGHFSSSCSLKADRISERACYICGEKSHLANTCPKRHNPKILLGGGQVNFSASGHPEVNFAHFPFVNVLVNDVHFSGLLDSGLSLIHI